MLSREGVPGLQLWVQVLPVLPGTVEVVLWHKDKVWVPGSGQSEGFQPLAHEAFLPAARTVLFPVEVPMRK